MHSTTIVIVFLSVGSVVMYSNINELCSKAYFDSYVALYWTGLTELQLSRKVDSNEMVYHSWGLEIEEQSNGFKTKQNEIQYNGKDGQTPKRSLVQPKSCAIDIVNRPVGGADGKQYLYDWVLNDLVVSNSVNGPTVVYTHKSIYMECVDKSGCDWDIEEKINRNQSSPLLLPQTLNGYSISINGLLCATKVSEITIYLIGEKNKSMSDSNRTQFVGRLKIEKREDNNQGFNLLNVWKAYNISLKFSLEIIDQTVIEFLGIDCQNITTIPTDSWVYEILDGIFWSLVISGAILKSFPTSQ